MNLHERRSAKPLLLQRRDAAILFADVVGYARLMERDEEGTHVALRRLRATIFEPAIQRCRGRVVRLAGDGLVALFDAAQDALCCAMSMQRGLAAAASRVQPADRIWVRMGINFAEILVDEEGIAGTGVNIAARLEAMSEQGGICISDAMRARIGQVEGGALVDAGWHQLKNIVQPVHVFKIALQNVCRGSGESALAPGLA